MNRLHHHCYGLPPNHTYTVREPFPSIYESVDKPSVYSKVRKNVSWRCAAITSGIITLILSGVLTYTLYLISLRYNKIDCLSPDCGGHGVCFNGICLCDKGWRGSDCTELESESLRCLPDCSHHGTFNIDTGQCICEPNWSGIDCSKEKCDLNCGSNGFCQSDRCVCNEGWTGFKCDQRLCDQRCLDHGQCNNGTCFCNQGWNGKLCTLEGCPKNCNNRGVCVEQNGEYFCSCNVDWHGSDCSFPVEKECGDKINNENVDCLDPNCSGHGVCVKGRCLCGRGWKGGDCSEIDLELLRCLPDCSRHGSFNIENGQCICEPHWTGVDCSQEKCDLDCGPNGNCQSDRCVCNEGWTGFKCEQRLCDRRCLDHGQCNNGTCFCHQGWNGKLCTLEGCPRNCNNRGACVEQNGEYFCSCNADWYGNDCSVPLEKECGDKIDNDNDGLTDCADSECCSSKDCINNPLCLKSADPLDILLRKQPLSPTASFFQRMQFLIEDDSVQSYAHRKAFNDSQVSVIRGQIISPSGNGLMGVRVGVVNDQYLGIVVSRDAGWFDIMVNGGSAVTLDFRRDPFKPIQRTVFVPWNQIVVIGQITMDSDEIKTPDYHRSSICVEHDYEMMRPTVSGTWKSGFNGVSSVKKMILEEGKIVQENIGIPGTDVNLIYYSHRASGYMSTIDLNLTPERIPLTLRLVHLKISLEGHLFEKVFEAIPHIEYTYSWNRRNVYRQKVYGVSTATVSVGYEYLNCQQVIWEVQTVQVAGHDMVISEVGGWNLDIHHRYNFHEGILQKGDGSTLYLKNLPHTMTTVMGDGQQRPLHCAYCNGLAIEQRLLAPVALTSGPDGSIYVGDFNLIRRITPGGQVTTIVELSASQVAYRYHLTIGPVDGKLYISDPEKHQILRSINNSNPSDPRFNLEVVVGSGVKCLPGDKNLCGDDRPARNARLAYPKGIVINLNGELFIADGTNIRYVDVSGIIHTLIGDHYHKLHWKPFPCTGTTPIQKVNLRWPTELAINPLDNSLHILDDHMILKLTPDLRIRVVAGRPTHCSSVITAQEDPESKKEAENLLGTQVFLETPQSMAFSTNGNLFIAESDSQMINRVRIVTVDGRIVKYAGMDLDCSCMENNCECFNSEVTSAINSKMSAIPSITVTPDGRLYICDQGNLRIRAVHSSLPTLDGDQEYTITSLESLEMYTFNRFGQHLSTKSLITSSSPSSSGSTSNNKKTIYTFSYNVNTSFGKLSSVTDSSGNKIHLFRDYSNLVKSIENSKGGKCSLTMSRTKMLSTITSSDGFTYNFEYNESTGLIKSRLDSIGVNSIFYQYNTYGRLTMAVNPSGESLNSGYSLTLEGVTVKLIKNLYDLKINYNNNNVFKRDKRSLIS
ncbi:teneurin-m-like isoform X2 [Panonychus citri]|uniref:teneurin-m-like isoform X2 n=1 Tax=Panonychus citri TaxID=50023 RepID=UPI00230756E9|nr:teneurin-m-like isoform X2 [Panonychus citri]